MPLRNSVVKKHHPAITEGLTAAISYPRGLAAKTALAGPSGAVNFADPLRHSLWSVVFRAVPHVIQVRAASNRSACVCCVAKKRKRPTLLKAVLSHWLPTLPVAGPRHGSDQAWQALGTCTRRCAATAGGETCLLCNNGRPPELQHSGQSLPHRQMHSDSSSCGAVSGHVWFHGQAVDPVMELSSPQSVFSGQLGLRPSALKPRHKDQHEASGFSKTKLRPAEIHLKPSSKLSRKTAPTGNVSSNVPGPGGAAALRPKSAGEERGLVAARLGELSDDRATRKPSSARKGRTCPHSLECVSLTIPSQNLRGSWGQAKPGGELTSNSMRTESCGTGLFFGCRSESNGCVDYFGKVDFATL